MNQDPMDRFSEALRAWARRPPQLTPRQAAARLAERLPQPQPSWWRQPMVRRLAAAAALLGALGLWWIRGSRAPTPDLPVAAVEIPPLDADVAVFWLDDETPLYLTLTPPRTHKEPRS